MKKSSAFHFQFELQTKHSLFSFGTFVFLRGRGRGRKHLCFSCYLPRGFSLFSSHIATLWAFSLYYYSVVPSHNHIQIPRFIPLVSPFPFSCSTYTLATFRNSHNHSIYNTIQSFHIPPHLFSPSLLSTPTSHFLHQPNWDLNNRDRSSCFFL